ALAAAHEQGVIHRDMKPANCFRLDRMGSQDFIKVFDFGIAKLCDDFTGVTLTRKGAVVGTPDYMAPEQCRGKTVDTRTDLYAVGVIAFEMLTGRVPFVGRRPTDIMHAHVYEEAPPMSDLNSKLDAPAGAEAIVRRAMAKDPDQRFQTAREFAQAIIDDGEGLPTGKAGGFFRGLKKMFGR
ncbi:MAG: serine/threonine-protein kinase, partial [Myxococcota bacterium]